MKDGKIMRQYCVYDTLQPNVTTIYSTSVIHLIQWPMPGVRRHLTVKKSTHVEENFVPCRTTFSTASKKSRSVATFRLARMANIPAYEIVSEHIQGRKFLPYLSSYRSQLCSRRIGAQTSNQIEANVTFNTHTTQMNDQHCVVP